MEIVKAYSLDDLREAGDPREILANLNKWLEQSEHLIAEGEPWEDPGPPATLCQRYRKDLGAL